MSARAEWFYRRLLGLYPAEFRAQYGRAMLDFHRDRVAMARRNGESMVALWLLTIADVVTSAAAEHLRPFLSGDAVMETIVQDLAYALRGLRRRPAFTAIVVATIALGVGANAAIFSVVSGILLRPLPYPHAEQVFLFGHEPPQWLSSDPDFLDYHREMKTLGGLAAYTKREATLSTNGQPERIRLVRASNDFFPVLGVKPLLGRVFLPDEYIPRVAPTIVLSYGLWQRDFGSDRTILGKKVSVEGAPRVVVGVMPPNFDFPHATTDAWMPLQRFNPDSMGDRAGNYLFMVGRLKPGATLEGAKAEATGIAQRIMMAEPNKFDPKSPLKPAMKLVNDELVGNTRPYLLALLGAVGFVLLIACANVANLLLVRGEGRRKELALRSALGASGRRLVVQLLTESLLLSGIGAALGLALAWAADRALIAAAPSSIPRVAEIAMDWRVFAYTAAVAVLTGLLVSVAPAWSGARGDVAATLKEGGKTTASDGSSRIARRALVVAEMALAVTMLSGAGMLLRSLWHLENAGLGFEPKGVLTAKVSIAAREYDDARTVVFYDQVLERIRAIPGVRAASAAGWLPVVDAGGLWGYRPEGGNYPEGRWPNAVPQQITPGYFAAMGMPILAGRDINADDRETAPPVAVVSKRFAELAWPGANPIGRRFQVGNNMPYHTVVGMVGDLRSRGFGDTPEATMYFAHAQTAKYAYYVPRPMALIVRVNGNPLAVGEAVRKAVQSLDRNAPVSEMRTLERVAGLSVAIRRFNTALLAAFAGLALLLAGIGTYGVISYGVTQRRFEIGVRMALGAANRSVFSLVMSEGMRLAAIGLGIGLFASVAVGRAIRAMLVGVAAVDAPSLALTAVLLAIVAVVASLLPALRALRVNPLEALRSE